MKLEGWKSEGQDCAGLNVLIEWCCGDWCVRISLGVLVLNSNKHAHHLKFK